MINGSANGTDQRRASRYEFADVHLHNFALAVTKTCLLPLQEMYSLTPLLSF